MAYMFGQKGATWTLSSTGATITAGYSNPIGISNPGFTLVAGQAIQVASTTAPSNLPNGTYYVSAYPAPTPTAFSLCSTGSNAINATSGNYTTNNLNIGSTGIGSGVTVSATPGGFISASPSVCLASIAYSPTVPCIINAIGFQSTSGGPAHLEFGLYNVTTPALVGQTASVANFSGQQLSSLVSPVLCLPGQQYKFSAIQDTGYIGGECQGTNAYGYVASEPTIASMTAGGVYSGGPIGTLPGLTTAAPEFIIWADGVQAVPAALLAGSIDLSFLGRH